MPQSIYLLHFVLVSMIAIFILTKMVPTANIIVFIIMLSILITQMYMIQKDKIINLENYEESEVLKIKDLDLTHVKKLGDLPNVTKRNINDGLDAIISSTSGKGEFTSLYESTERYKDEGVRKAYKHIDYFLEKLNLFDGKIYDVIVPNYSKEVYDANQQKDTSFSQ